MSRMFDGLNLAEELKEAPKLDKSVTFDESTLLKRRACEQIQLCLRLNAEEPLILKDLVNILPISLEHFAEMFAGV